MLEALFASENIKRILLYLFVNRKCYGSLLQKTFNSALTPFQHALGKLENGGVLTSYFEGKTKIYLFNQGYALFEELQALLKKAYLNLSSAEKLPYSSNSKAVSFLSRETAQSQLFELWEKLSTIKALKMHVKSASGLNAGIGIAEVEVEKISKNTLIFKEKGEWKETLSQNEFANVFQWTLDPYESLINLEHLRHGKNHPTFLFSLFPCEKGTFSSLLPMHCNQDIYIGKLACIKGQLNLHCRVIGPKKNEEISYCYS